MRAVVQRVSGAAVEVNNEVAGKINEGLIIFLGISGDDTDKDIDYFVDKVVNLRVFEDGNKKMNLSLLDIDGDILIVSQFTLYGDCRKGRRPSYEKAAKPEYAKTIYEQFIEKMRSRVSKVQTGIFGQFMKVKVENSGPVTLLLDSFKSF